MPIPVLIEVVQILRDVGIYVCPDIDADILKLRFLNLFIHLAEGDVRINILFWVEQEVNPMAPFLLSIILLILFLLAIFVFLRGLIM